ncbi:MAG: 4-hydroxy-tetrahydrodipicolinate reductase [Methanotrichaceae archaeon]
MKIRVAVAGARGRMGRLLVEDVHKSEKMELVAGFDLRDIGEPLGGGVTLSDAADLAETLNTTKTDVLIDFTAPSASVENVQIAASNGVNLVVGTTGFSEDQQNEMAQAIDSQVSAVISPNFSVGVNIFWTLIEVAAQALQSYDVEIIEAHHKEKKDAPSGTAAKAVKILAKAMNLDEIVYGREGQGLRGQEIGVHAIRAGDIVGDHIVLFAGPGERLEIKHQAHSRQAFVSGAIVAAGWVMDVPPGIYSMADVLNLES